MEGRALDDDNYEGEISSGVASVRGVDENAYGCQCQLVQETSEEYGESVSSEKE